MRLVDRSLAALSEANRQRVRQLHRDVLTALAQASQDFRECADLTLWLDREG
ncbi:hypothetical protein CKO23_01685 [Thiocystis violacea]|nr:hypothetical protein [Thiocystis violacea]